MGARRPWSRRAKLLLAVLSPVVVFGALELGLRIGGYRYEPAGADTANHTHDEIRERRIYAPHPELLWTLRPSSRLDLPERGFTGIPSNSAGLRGPELPGPKEAGELRVLCLGDSVTFGLGLADGETWPDRMEQALRRAPETAGRKVRVINAAVPGWSSVQGLRLLTRLPDLEPDVILFWFGMNDASPVRGVPDSRQHPSAGGTPDGATLLRRLRVIQLADGIVAGLRQQSDDATRVSQAEFARNVRDVRQAGRAMGARVLFVHEPEQCAVTIRQLEQVVKRAEEEGVDRVIGPAALLTWIAPAPEEADLTGRRVERRDGPAIVFAPDPSAPGYERADQAADLDRLRADLATLRELKRSFDSLTEGLPEDSLHYADLFGDAYGAEVFTDNCHLSAFGARRAGEALATVVLEALER